MFNRLQRLSIVVVTLAVLLGFRHSAPPTLVFGVLAAGALIGLIAFFWYEGNGGST